MKEYRMAGMAGHPSESAYIAEKEAQRSLDTYKGGIFSAVGLKFDQFNFSPTTAGKLGGDSGRKKKKAYGDDEEVKKKVTKKLKDKIEKKSFLAMKKVSVIDPNYLASLKKKQGGKTRRKSF